VKIIAIHCKVSVRLQLSSGVGSKLVSYVGVH